MRPVGIGHQGEIPAFGHQGVRQLFGALVVDIVVAGAVDNQKVPLQLGRVGDG